MPAKEPNYGFIFRDLIVRVWGSVIIIIVTIITIVIITRFKSIN
jgi:hypothetical protein